MAPVVNKITITVILQLVRRFLPPVWATAVVVVLLALGLIAEVPSWSTTLLG